MARSLFKKLVGKYRFNRSVREGVKYGGMSKKGATRFVGTILRNHRKGR